VFSTLASETEAGSLARCGLRRQRSPPQVPAVLGTATAAAHCSSPAGMASLAAHLQGLVEPSARLDALQGQTLAPDTVPQAGIAP